MNKEYRCDKCGIYWGSNRHDLGIAEVRTCGICKDKDIHIKGRLRNIIDDNVYYELLTDDERYEVVNEILKVFKVYIEEKLKKEFISRNYDYNKRVEIADHLTYDEKELMGAWNFAAKLSDFT